MGVVRNGWIYFERRPDGIFDTVDVGYQRSQRWASRFLVGSCHLQRLRNRKNKFRGGEENQELSSRHRKFETPIKQLELVSRQIRDRIQGERLMLEINLLFTHTNDTGSIIPIFRL